MALEKNLYAIIQLQDQSEKFVSQFMDKVLCLPESGKKTVVEWLSNYKKGLDSFRSFTDENYEKVARYFDMQHRKKLRKLAGNPNQVWLYSTEKKDCIIIESSFKHAN